MTSNLQSRKCDGNHGGPRCHDPECWNDAALEAGEEGVLFGYMDRSVRVSQEAYAIFLERERGLEAQVSALGDEVERLRGAGGAEPGTPYSDPRNGAETWSANGEDWHNIGGIAELIRESADDLESLKEGDEVFVGSIFYQDPAGFVDHQELLERMNESAGCSDAGEWVDSWPEPGKPAEDELKALLNGWARRHCAPDFYLVQNVRIYTITAEDLACANDTSEAQSNE